MAWRYPFTESPGAPNRALVIFIMAHYSRAIKEFTSFSISLICNDITPTMRKDLVIGIDPGKVTGLAIYKRSSKEIVFTISTDFFGVFEILNSYDPADVESVIVEIPNNKAVWHKKASNRRTQDRTAVNVGGCIREAELMAGMATMVGHNVLKVHPLGKMSADMVMKITGYNGKPNNSHVRDAIMLCWGR